MCSNAEGGLMGCVVVFAAFSIQVLCFGTSQSVGVYNIEFLRYFDVGAAAVSLVGSINIGVFLGAGPLASVLMSRWTHRQVALSGAVLSSIGLICMPFAPNIPYMYAFYGVITGLGNCLMYVPSHVLSGLYYNKHRSIATGIATAGSGLGATIFPVVIYNLIEHYGWRGSLFILAGLNLHNFIFCSLLFRVPEKSTKENIQETEKLTSYIDRRKNSIGESVYMLRAHSISLSEIKEEHAHIDTQVTFKKDSYNSTTVDRDQTISLNGSVPNSKLQRRQSVSQRLERHFCSIFSFAFIVYFLSNIFWNAGGAIILIFLPEYMTSIGFSKEEASSIFTLVGAGTCVGCILGGLLGNIKNINRELIYILGNLAAGSLALLYPWQLLHTKLGQIILSASFGLAFGIILGLLVVVTADLLGTESLGDGFGYLMLANGIGIFSGPPVAGILMDIEGTLDPGMYLSGALTIMGGLVMCVVPIHRKFTSESVVKVVEIEMKSPEEI